MGLKQKVLFILLGALSTLVLLSCTATTFNYRYYPYDYDGKMLIAADPVNDLSDSVCMPREGNLRPCVVIMSDEFFKLKSDYLKTKDALIRCEKER